MKRIRKHFYWLAEKMGFGEMDEVPKTVNIKFGNCKKSKYKTNNSVKNPLVNKHNNAYRAESDQGE